MSHTMNKKQLFDFNGTCCAIAKSMGIQMLTISLLRELFGRVFFFFFLFFYGQ